MSDPAHSFDGAKLALFLGPRLLVYLRDDFAHLPFPGHWDLPGGARDGRESPAACVLRETEEEFGLRLAPDALLWARAYDDAPGRVGWFFVARQPAGLAASIVFGEEGQEWRLVRPLTFLRCRRAVPMFQTRLRHALDAGV